jgi:hypothetical protein
LLEVLDLSDRELLSDEIDFARRFMHLEDKLDAHERQIIRIFRKKFINEQKEMLTHALQQSQLYNTAIIGGAYAAFFAVWLQLKDIIITKSYVLAIVLILFSLVVFLGWNVYNMFRNGSWIHRKLACVHENISKPDVLFSRIQIVDAQMVASTISKRWIWCVVVVLSCGTGFSGLGIMFYDLVRHLLSVVS